MHIGRLALILLLGTAPVCLAQTGRSALEINAQACDTLIGDESKASVHTRATDKAEFAGIRKLERIAILQKTLGDSELNVLIYRLIDEYVEDLSVETLPHEDNRVCVRVKGKISPEAIDLVEKDFIKDGKPISEPSPEAVQQAAVEATEEVSVKPENPESLALVYLKNLTYFNGQETSRFTEGLTDRFKDNAYFYLTGEADLADYTLAPKVLKAKVDTLDAEHKRLQMVITIEVTGLEADPVNISQNRFVLFNASENEQQIAARFIRKLLDKTADEVLRRIEHHEQLKFEKNTLGKTVSE
jgi:hypothetical protein